MMHRYKATHTASIAWIVAQQVDELKRVVCSDSAINVGSALSISELTAIVTDRGQKWTELAQLLDLFSSRQVRDTAVNRLFCPER